MNGFELLANHEQRKGPPDYKGIAVALCRVYDTFGATLSARPLFDKWDDNGCTMWLLMWGVLGACIQLYGGSQPYYVHAY